MSQRVGQERVDAENLVINCALSYLKKKKPGPNKDETLLFSAGLERLGRKGLKIPI